MARAAAGVVARPAPAPRPKRTAARLANGAAAPTKRTAAKGAAAAKQAKGRATKQANGRATNAANGGATNARAGAATTRAGAATTRRATAARRTAASRRAGGRAAGGRVHRRASGYASAGGSVALPLPVRVLNAPFSRALRARGGQLLDALLAGRGWIVLVGVLLAGIVFFNVDLLKLNRDIAGTAEQIDQLKRENGRYREQVASAASSERIQEAAATLGLVLPAPGDVRYLKAHPDADARLAVKRMTEPSDLFAAPAPVASAPTPSGTTLGTTTTGVTGAGVTGTDPTATGATGTGVTDTTATGTTGTGTTTGTTDTTTGTTGTVPPPADTTGTVPPPTGVTGTGTTGTTTGTPTTTAPPTGTVTGGAVSGTG